MQLFYSENVFDKVHFLPEAESKHLIRVLRKRFGDTIKVTDGKGNLYECQIADDNPKKCALEVINKERFKNNLTRNIHVAIAPTKNNDRLDWFIEKATEIGVSSITPIICDHSERVKLKPERVNKVAISAMKQSKRLYLPRINTLTKFSDFIAGDQAGRKLIAHCEEENKAQLSALKIGASASILIGPEGDFSENEIDSALKAGYKAVALGESRLRTETAGIVACTLLNHI